MKVPLRFFLKKATLKSLGRTLQTRTIKNLELDTTFILKIFYWFFEGTIIIS